jgi:hypothetical protein
MNNSIFNLVQLENPINPRKKEIRYIYFSEPKIIPGSLPTVSEEGELEEESVSNIPSTKPKPFIIDQRKQHNINRSLIYRRLAEKNLNLVKNPKLVIPLPLPPEQVQVSQPIQEENIIAAKPKKLKIREGAPIIAKSNIPFEKPIAAKPKKLKIKIAEPQPDITAEVLRAQQAIQERLPTEKEKIIVKAPSYYMSNRKIYSQKIAQLFQPYRKELLDTTTNVSCDIVNTTGEFNLLSHQKIVRDYLNLYTPYRGLLLYFGLGTGKTCSAIAIAEGMKSNKRVYVLTPASLKMNFFSEMKKCGDELYKKNQFWEFISVEGRPEFIQVLAKALSLSTESIEKNRGAWLVNIKKQANFTDLTTEQQNAIDTQLNEMIRSKYIDLNYNGLNRKKIDALTENGQINPFDNAVVIIDEAHDFVSRIVNKIKTPDSISYQLYDNLMSASNAKIVLLTGTPIINYPNEIGILFNILRGYIKTWVFVLNIKTNEKITTETLLEIFDKEHFKTFDYVEYSGNKLTITRNPFGFVNTKKRGALKGVRAAKGGATRRKQPKKNSSLAKRITFKRVTIDKEDEVPNDPYNGVYGIHEGGAGGDVFDRYNGVTLDESGNISDTDFQQTVVRILKKHGMEVQINNIELIKYKALPDDADTFLNTFVNTDTGEADKMNLFQRRILGLTSYFRSAQEELLPRYVRTAQNDIFHIVKTEMSPHQFSIYEKIRKVEADKERNAKKRKRQGDLFTIASTYRVFSRAACNFVFPDEIKRPVPEVETEIGERQFDANIEIDENAIQEEENEETSPKQELSYAARIQQAMQEVNVNVEGTAQSKYLDKDVLENLSPKMAAVLENLSDEDNRGLHLLYSHFRSIEGIGIMKLILLANGFAEFKILKNASEWEMVENEEDEGKPRFMLYTGTETAEEKEILRNIYNSNWEYIPASLSAKLKEKYENNFYGEVVKIIMITASGAQGINLKNTRFVHILEPYWHMVRIDQVVGRARRICSHQDLPEELRTVKVFLYVSVLSEQQKTDENNIELRIRDISRIDKKTPITTDESLYEIASLKQKINNQILRAVKETAIDCQLYASVNKKKKKGEEDEELVCYGYGKVESNRFSSYPSLENDKNIKEDARVQTWAATKVVIDGTTYAYNTDTKELYDYESYERAARNGSEPVLIGRLENQMGQYRIVPV